MNRLLARVQDAARARAVYRRTVNEIANISPDVARDLGIDPSDAERIARKAVYGR